VAKEERWSGSCRKYDVDKMIEIINEYTDNTAIPILKEVCYLNGWSYKYVYYKLSDNNECLKEAIQRLLDKKEAQLERLALIREIDSKMAQFSLVQLGWRNEQNIKHSGADGGAIKIRWMTENEAEEEEE